MDGLRAKAPIRASGTSALRTINESDSKGTSIPTGVRADGDTDSIAEQTGDGIYADGSCLGNPGPGGWAFVRVKDDRPIHEESGCDPATTNNRMEFLAVIAALKSVAVDEKVTIFTDSKLVVDTLNRWAQGWERRGWTRKGDPLKNLDLVKPAYALMKARPGVRVEWVKGHDGNQWNEYVDGLANAAAVEARLAG